MKIIYETGILRELGEMKSYGNVRLFTLIELEHADGKRVRLENVAVTIMVTPKFVVGEKCTVAFYNGTVTSMDKSVPNFRNLLLGYASADNFGIANQVSPGMMMFYQAGTVLLGLVCLWLLFSGGPWLFLLVGGVPAFLFFLLYFTQNRKNNNAISSIRAKFADLGYTDRVATVYN